MPLLLDVMPPTLLRLVWPFEKLFLLFEGDTVSVLFLCGTAYYFAITYWNIWYCWLRLY